jgi:hypothetical protein
VAVEAPDRSLTASLLKLSDFDPAVLAGAVAEPVAILIPGGGTVKEFAALLAKGPFGAKLLVVCPITLCAG